MPIRDPIPAYFRVLIPAAAVLFCIIALRWLDAPVARCIESLWRDPYGPEFLLLQHALTLALTALLVLPVLGVFGIGRFIVLAMRGIAPGRRDFVLALAGLSLAGSLAVNELLLKPFFGRHAMGDYFAHPGFHGFVFLHGSPASSFPSGHTVMVVSFLAVVAAFYPHRRAAILTVIAITLTGLVVGGWHFPSDVAAGIAVGATGASAAIRLGRRSRREP